MNDMNKSNPFTVPDGFFGEARARALKGADCVRSLRISIAAAVAALAIVLAIPAVVSSRQQYSSVDVDDALAELYESDIFLHTYFE